MAWIGGHADGDSDLLHVALKEANEEKMKPIYKKLNEKIGGNI